MRCHLRKRSPNFVPFGYLEVREAGMISARTKAEPACWPVFATKRCSGAMPRSMLAETEATMVRDTLKVAGLIGLAAAGFTVSTIAYLGAWSYVWGLLM
jgi:hypothetical protein